MSTHTNEALIDELKHEAANTRKILERVPLDKADWKPHEKSMTLGRLATHVAEMMGWIKSTIEQDELDFSKVKYVPKTYTTTKELLDNFDKMTKEAVGALTNTTEQQLMHMWTMRNAEQVYFTMPKASVIRYWSLNHVCHHRGQLSVYLRLLDVALPAIYGPTADEGNM